MKIKQTLKCPKCGNTQNFYKLFVTFYCYECGFEGHVSAHLTPYETGDLKNES